MHLAPAPVVARVATTIALIRPDPRVWLTRELDVAGFLAGKGAPVVAPSDELPPGPHEHDGLHLTFWRFVEHLETAPDLTDVARSLADLHEVLRDYPGELPFLAPALEDVDRGIDYLEAHTPFAAEDLELLRGAHARVMAALAHTAEGGQALHGDAHAGNVLVTREGMLWNDFEDTCRGPIAWDLACLTHASSWSDEAALDAYRGAPAQAELELLIEARDIQGTMWLAVAGQRFAEHRAHAEARLNAMRERA